MTAKPVRPVEPIVFAVGGMCGLACAALSFVDGTGLGISGGIAWTLVAAGVLLVAVPSSIRDYWQRRDAEPTPDHEGHQIGTRHGGKR